MNSSKTGEPTSDPEIGDKKSKLKLQLELSIETERILNVLDGAISKLEVAMCVPMLLENNAIILYKFIPHDEAAFVVNTYSNYSPDNPESNEDEQPEDIQDELEKGIDTVRNSIIQYRTHGRPNYTVKRYYVATKESKKSLLPTDKSREDPDVCTAIEYLYSHPRLKNFIKDYLLQMISEPASIFLNYMRQLRISTAERLSVTPSQEYANEQNLRQTWKHNERAKEDIAILQEKLEALRNDGNSQLAAKYVIMRDKEDHIEKMKKQAKDDIKKIINDSEKNMISDWKNSEFKQEMLQEQVNDAKTKFEMLLSEHLNHEKDLRAKKIKVESQLLSVLSKYDADMGERQAEFEEITDGYNEEKRQMKELQEQFDIQEVEYIRLMTEKEEEEKIELHRKLTIFVTNRAARLIQRTWREYKRRKRARRKGRKKKK